MSSPNKPPEPPRWNTDTAQRSAEPAGAKPAARPGKKPAPVKRDESAAGEEDPGAALDSLDTEATGQPETHKPSKSLSGPPASNA